MVKTKKTIFHARSGATFTKEEAQVVGETLMDIKAKNCKLVPELVVDEAKNKHSPIHKYFDWSDNTAAKSWRLQQARYLIASVTEVVIIQGKESEQRSFFSVGARRNSETEYVTVQEAVTEKPYREQLLSEIITKMENLTQLMKMFKQYDQKYKYQ